MNNDYYVYVYCDPRTSSNLIVDDVKFDYLPFYIGYGRKNRINFHLKMKDSNLLKINKIKSIISDGYNPLIFKIRENLEQKIASNVEKYYIKEIGTILEVLNVKKGPLTNQTPGGDGGPTFFKRKLSEEHKDKIRKGNTGKIFSDERIKNMSIAQKNRNIEIDENKRLKMVDGLKNMKNESRENISKATKDTIWIYNENLRKNKRTHPDTASTYLEDGWIKGFKVFK